MTAVSNQRHRPTAGRAIIGGVGLDLIARKAGLHAFMVVERFRPGKAPEVYRRFRDRGRMAPDTVRYVASWVDLGFERCFQVMDAEDETPLHEWIANWRDLIDFEIIPVRTSADAAAVMGRTRELKG